MCGIVGIINTDGQFIDGSHIRKAIRMQRDSGNGLGWDDFPPWKYTQLSMERGSLILRRNLFQRKGSTPFILAGRKLRLKGA